MQAAAPAYAQDGGAGGDTAQPVKLGVFNVNAGVSASRVYSDNVFSTESNEISDQSNLFSGFVRLESDLEKHKLDIYGGGTVGRYRDQDNEEYEDYFIGADGRFDLNEQHYLFGGFEHAREHEERSSPDDVNGTEPTLYKDSSAYAGYSGNITDANAVRFGVNSRKLDFDDVAAANGTINNDDRDRYQHEIGLRASHSLQPGLDVFGQGVIDIRRYDDQTDDLGRQRDSDGYRLGGGLSLRFGGDVVAEGFAGVMQQDYDDPAFSSVTTPYAGLYVSAPLAPHTIGRISYSRSIDETTLANASSVVSDIVTASVDVGVTESIDFSAYTSLIREDFQEVNLTADRRDESLLAGVEARYWFLPNFYFAANYDFIDQDSSFANNDFTENVVALTIGAELNAHQRETFRISRGPALPFDGAYGGVQGIVEQFQDDQNGPRQGQNQLSSEYATWSVGGGLVAGYGRRIYEDFYGGVEIEGNKQDNYWNTAQDPGGRDENGEKTAEYGAALRAGYVVNEDVLYYVRGGLTSADFVQQIRLGDGREFDQQFQQDGYQYGIGAEAALGSGMSLRMEYVHTSYPAYTIDRGGAGAGAPDQIEEFDNSSNQLRVAAVYQLGGWDEDVRQALRNPREAEDFDGLYTGLQGGLAQFNSVSSGLRANGTANRTADQGAAGFQGGPYVGYGMIFGGGFYLGLEADGNAADSKWDFHNSAGRVIAQHRSFDASLNLRGGYVVNDSILLYGRVGPAVAYLETDVDTAQGPSSSDNDLVPGIRFGAGIETFLDQNWRLRSEYVATIYDSIETRFTDGAFSAVEEYEPTDGAFRIGLSYHY